MTKEEKQANLEKKVQELWQFAKDKQMEMTGVQKVSPEGYIENTILFRDMENYDKPKEVLPEETK